MLLCSHEHFGQFLCHIIFSITYACKPNLVVSFSDNIKLSEYLELSQKSQRFQSDTGSPALSGGCENCKRWRHLPPDNCADRFFLVG